MKNLYSLEYDVLDYMMGNNLEKLASIMPSLSKTTTGAELPTYEDELARPETDFAVSLVHSKLGTRNKYACYNAPLTEINMHLLADKINDLPEEIVKVAATNLTCSAKKFKLDIPEPLKKYASNKYVSRELLVEKIDEKAFAEKQAGCKTTSKKKSYALNGKYPISSKGEVKKASAWFDKNYGKLSIDEQLEFASNILPKMAEYSVELEKTCALHDLKNIDAAVFSDEFYNHMQIRKSYLPEDNDELIDSYNDLLKRADEFGVLKTAYLVELLDREANLDNLYGKKIVDPLHAVMGYEKKAGREIDGVLVTPEMLRSLDSKDLTPIVGNDVIPELKGADGLDVLASLPTPVRKDILRMFGGE